MLKTNVKQLVKIAIEGKVAPALVWPNEIGNDGRVHNIPSLGGITYNVAVGDPAFGWEADHVEPCVSSIQNAEKRSERSNVAYNFLSCIGNEARILTGNAKGKKGIVVGTHGGVEHVMIDFSPEVTEKLSLDDKFQIRSFGQGLRLEAHPDITISSIDPSLLEKMNIKEGAKGIEVRVAGIVPCAIMGSGLGELQSKTGDIDIITSDKSALAEHGLEDLKLGDIVAITDCDASFGWCYRKGAVTISVVIHGDSHLSGHGPGTTVIMTSAKGMIKPVLDKNANIGRYLKIGRFRKK